MAHKSLFAPASKSKAADTINQAGGRAYAFSAEHTLAQYAATGTFNRTYYASEDEQLQTVLDLAQKVDPAFLARTTLYCREKGTMKDMPALLAAVLSTRDARLLGRVFPRVIDNGKMLRNFVQIVRSGVVGRKSFGSAPKRLARAWFSERSPENVFRQSLGNDPSLQDVIKMIRPPPKLATGEVDAAREALYGYLIGRDVPHEKLPPLVQAFESFKKDPSSWQGDVPDVPFEMLTALELDTERWTAIAKRMSFTQLRMNLNTLLRHGVFGNEGMVSLVASKLRDPEQVRRSRLLPFQLLAAFKAVKEDMPAEITMALQEAMEIAIENVPTVSGKIFLCPDVSGSMQSSITGYRKGATSAVRCVDVAALVSAAFLRRNTSAEVIPFSDDVVAMPRRLNPLDSVMTNAQYLASLPSGGTACSAPLRHLNRTGAKGDLVIFISDNVSWADFGRSVPGLVAGTAFGLGKGTRATVMAEEWDRFRARNPNAKLVLIDIQPYGSTQMHERADVFNVGGFSDSVFELIALFSKGQLGAEHWLSVINGVSLD
ncbi:Putative ribonucleoprotein related-protein TROVE domain protein [Labilithrix luteola]|uniref:Putative ribonucleoprotein related-protein TROVE domain protein n=1 Tax=Labilithrix luteola TaxID=1391654 RepID=A0A0K1PLZ8_9BACT|nr:TROVE domain-containing protein [Labilithrix luteola]AKU94563.1 Putative ribonucleoprotein related-protein TROVE domain protein [Labilithrix luteola]